MKKVHQRLNKMNRENRLLYKKELRAAMRDCDKLNMRIHACIDHMEELGEQSRGFAHRAQSILLQDVYANLYRQLSYIEQWEKEKAGVK